MLLSPLFETAFLYATHVHAGQARKATGIPYITHLMAVAAIVAEYGGDEVQVIAALLHDAPEDQGGEGRLEDIRQRFGEDVARIVSACSDTFEDPKPPWWPRKEAYLKHLELAPTEVLLVSAADKLHNSRAIVADLRTGRALRLRQVHGREQGDALVLPDALGNLHIPVPGSAGGGGGEDGGRDAPARGRGGLTLPIRSHRRPAGSGRRYTCRNGRKTDRRGT